MARIKTYVENGYTFKQYSGNFQKIKFDSKLKAITESFMK